MIKIQPLLEELSPPHSSSPEKMSIVTAVSPNGVSLKASNSVVSESSDLVALQHIELESSLKTPLFTTNDKSFLLRDKADEIGDLVTKIVRIFLKNKSEELVQISLDLLHSPRCTRRTPRLGGSSSLLSSISPPISSSRSNASGASISTFLDKDSTSSKAFPVKSWSNFSGTSSHLLVNVNLDEASSSLSSTSSSALTSDSNDINSSTRSVNLNNNNNNAKKALSISPKKTDGK